MTVLKEIRRRTQGVNFCLPRISLLANPKSSELAERQVKSWVSSVWNNPLIDEATIRLRSKAPERFNQMFSAIAATQFNRRIDPAHFVAGQLMGAVMLAHPEFSDCDIVLYSDVPRMMDDFVGNYIAADEGTQNPWKKMFKEKFGIDIVEAEPIIDPDDPLASIESGNAGFLLSTPDKLLLGSPSVGQRGRLQLVNEVERMGEEYWREYWNNPTSQLKLKFREFYPEWPYRRERYYDEMEEGEEKQNRIDKRKLFMDRLLELAWKTDKPDVFVRAFWRWWVRLDLPDFEVYSTAIKRNMGALSME